MTFSDPTTLLRQVCHGEPPPAPERELQLCLELAADTTIAPHFLGDMIAESPSLHRRFMILVKHFHPEVDFIRNAQAACAELPPELPADLLWILALTDVMTAENNRACRRLWKHSLLTAALADRSRSLLSKPINGPIWTAAMAHDVGHLLIPGPAVEKGVDWHSEHDRLVDREPPPSLMRDHCLIGSSLLSLWNAPEEAVLTARHHHHPLEVEDDIQPIVTLVRLADLIAEHVDAEQPHPELSLGESKPWTMLEELCGFEVTSADQLLADVLIPASTEADRLSSLLAK